MEKIVFFGGCFNPPTIAHYELALKALKCAKLDKIYFVPMGDCYKKDGLAPAEDRFQMLKVMTNKNDKLDISRIQMDQKRKLQAIDTFRLINKEFCNSKNFFIMGSDNFEKISTWKDAKELLTSYEYIVLSRGNFKEENVIIIEDKISLKKISSSLVRNKILNNENIEKLVTKEVEKYILENKLYKQTA